MIKRLLQISDAFPYGRAPFGLLLVLCLAWAVTAIAQSRLSTPRKPDIVLTSFSRDVVVGYADTIAAFEKEHGITIRIDIVSLEALQSRLQNAMLTGSEVPDMVELVESNMGFFTAGPLEDVGFVDLTDRVRAEGLDREVVQGRFSSWTSRGRIFALPHDVHPVVLAYRSDLVEKLGINVEELETWEDFAAMGRKITRDLDGDGIIDRYALDLPLETWGIKTMLLQRDAGAFDAAGRLTMETETVVDTLEWYALASEGPSRFTYPCGWSQSFYRCMLDGFALFYLTPDWRARAYQLDTPSLAGKMKLMPLPAWQRGARRVSVFGGSGMAITKQCKHPDLAWKLAKLLYYNKAKLGDRFRKTGILPPLRAAWELPQLAEPNAFYSNQPIGALFARLANDVPPSHPTPYSALAESKLYEVYQDAVIHLKQHGAAGLRERIRESLRGRAVEVREVVDRNLFLKRSAPSAQPQ